MFNLFEEINEFCLEIEKLKLEKFKNFHEMECEYCRLINQGNGIRNYLILHPEECDENTLLVLTNKTSDLSLLDEKFKCLLHIVYLTQNLFDRYTRYVVQLKQEGQYNEAIRVYEQMFNLSRNYLYRQEIANIKFQIYKQVEESFLIYKNIEQYLAGNQSFWLQFSDIYKAKNDVFNQILCVQKALELGIL